jgi:DNA polymerase elongation subunit (family B)
MYQNIFYDRRKNKIHIWDDKFGQQTFRYKKYAYTKNRTGNYVSLYGDKLTKITKWDKDQPNLFESDVNPEIRVLVDKYTESDEPSVGHKVMIIDIEVEVTDGFPDVEIANNKITSIAFNDPLTDEYFCLVLDEKSVLNEDFGENVTIETFLTEYELLNRFYVKYREIQPTILTGWNIEFFDIPYLYNRAQQILGQDVANLLSPIHIVRWSNFKKRYIIAGVSILDYLSLYKRFTFSQKSSYRLDVIGELEVGDKKIEYEGTLNELYENDLKTFVEYNLQDVKLVKKLDDKLDFIEIARGLAHLGHTPYESVYMSSHYLEGAILVYLKKNNIVAPNKAPRPKDFNKDDKFIGAYVQDPIKGKHDWVYDLDITSMYPSCIMSLNISPETKIGKIKGWNPEEFLQIGNKKTYTILHGEKEIGKFTEVELKSFLDNEKVSVSTNGVMYRSDKDGLLPALLKKWFDERVEYRKLSKKFHEEGDKEKSDYFDRRQYLQKVVLNSLYGVLGLPVFRFYDVDNAEAVTTTGQSLIKFTKKVVNYYYNKELNDNENYCIYIDTDSVFYSALPLVKNRYPDLNTKNEEKMSKVILEIASEVQEYLNKGYDYFAKKFCNLDKHRFEIKQEVIAKSGLFVTKKRYGLKIINDNGKKVNKMMIKGLDTVRSSFPIAMKEMLSKLLEDILMDVPKDNLDKFIVNFKDSMKLVPFEKIAIPTGVKGLNKYQIESVNLFRGYKKGTPIHVKASIVHNDLLKYYKLDKKYQSIVNNEKIKWVYLKQNEFGLQVMAFKGYDDAPQIIKFIKTYINPEKIYKHALHKKIMMLYDSMSWSEPTDKSKTIERFF